LVANTGAPYQVSVDGGTYTAPSSGLPAPHTLLQHLNLYKLLHFRYGACAKVVKTVQQVTHCKNLSAAIFIPNVFTQTVMAVTTCLKFMVNSVSGIAMKIFDNGAIDL